MRWRKFINTMFIYVFIFNCLERSIRWWLFSKVWIQRHGGLARPGLDVLHNPMLNGLDYDFILLSVFGTYNF